MVNDWPLITIGDCFDFKNGLNKEKEFFGHGNPIINYMDVYKNNSIHSDDIKGKVELSDNEIRRYEVRRGDVFFTRTSETPEEVGLSAVLLDNVENCTFSGFVLRARPKNDWLMPEYCKYCFSTEFVRKSIIEGCTYTTRALTNGTQLSKIPIPLPPKCEQQVIVRVLSDIDNLISTQEALIAKKQAIKQGAMQELLTEKRRLAGFREKWNRVTLGDIGGLYKGSGISRADMGTGDIAAIRYGELYTFYGAYTHEINTRISAEVAEEAFGLQYGDIVFAGSGETHEEIGKCTAYVLDEKAYAGGDTIILRPNVKCHSVYLGYLLNTSQVQEQKAALGQGDAVVHISAKSLSTIEVELPKYEEQVAIGEMLLDIDNDIANQQAKLEKLRRIKSGMMDKLLTGKIRLTD